jgi:hypothetical protein
MEKLIEILKKFDFKRKEFLEAGNWNKDAVSKCFRPCAEEILLKGYFLVNDAYIIDLGSIELYYHEENGSIKDHIMYHTNEHHSKSKVFEFEQGFPYYEIGSFNLHQSGIDVTFENKKEQYRASFLIRSYRVLKKDEDPKTSKNIFDSCSTHLFDDMFYTGVLSTANIKWIKYDMGGEIETFPRKNVAEYVFENNKFVKKQVLITEEEYKKDPRKYIKINNKYLAQDTRRWQFKRKGIVEK